MMNNHRFYKAYIDRAIALDPLTITITRTTAADNGYGGTTNTTATIPPQTVRLYTPKGKGQLLVEAGKVTSYSRVLEKILASGGSDIEEGDLFTKGTQTYRITFVRDYFGICKQCEIEAIKL